MSEMKLEDFRLGGSDYGEIFLEHAVEGCYWEVQVGGLSENSPRLELGSVIEAAREHVRTAHVAVIEGQAAGGV